MNRYTFIMPDSNVTVDVSFRDAWVYRPPYYDYDYRSYRPTRPERTEKVEREEEITEPVNKTTNDVLMMAILSEGSNVLEQYINGIKANMPMDIAPYIKDNRIMLPMRYVAEALGLQVTWQAQIRTVLIWDLENRIEVPVDTNEIIVNGMTYTSDAKPEIKNNRTMLPIGNIARALGLEDGKGIIWDAVNKRASITRLIKGN